MSFNFTGVVSKESKAPDKRIKNVWEYAVDKALKNIEKSQKRWEGKLAGEVFDAKEFKAPCWRPKNAEKGEYALSLKVGTKGVPLENYDDDEPKMIINVHEEEVSANLAMMHSTVSSLKKGDSGLAGKMYEAGKLGKQPKGYEEGKTKSSTNADGTTTTHTCRFKNDEWVWE